MTKTKLTVMFAAFFLSGVMSGMSFNATAQQHSKNTLPCERSAQDLENEQIATLLRSNGGTGP